MHSRGKSHGLGDLTSRQMAYDALTKLNMNTGWGASTMNAGGDEAMHKVQSGSTILPPSQPSSPKNGNTQSIDVGSVGSPGIPFGGSVKNGSMQTNRQEFAMDQKRFLKKDLVNQLNSSFEKDTNYDTFSRTFGKEFTDAPQSITGTRNVQSIFNTDRGGDFPNSRRAKAKQDARDFLASLELTQGTDMGSARNAFDKKSMKNAFRSDTGSSQTQREMRRLKDLPNYQLAQHAH